MRGLLICSLAILLANCIQAADVFKNEKVKLGKRTCTCTFTMETKGDKCAGQAKCDKKCTGNGAVEVGDYSFTLAVKKGKGKIAKCTVAVMPTVGPVEPTGSGSGPPPPTGSGSGEVPVPMGEGMPCSCRCNCPDGAEQCDCDCNCPMMSTSVSCASGFTRVCPMMSDVCPTDTMMICPNGGMPPAAGRMMHGSSGSSGCQCVPDFLMALVHHAMPAATRMEATDRAKDVFKNEKVKLGKRTCTCTFTMETKGTKCTGQAKCDKKCTGNGAVEVGDYSFTLAVKKGKGKIAKCTVAVMPTVGPVEPTGSGSGPVEPTGSGSGPTPPTGSGSGEVPVPMGEGMPCSCRCNCPDGAEQCDCDCNCPMMSTSVSCASGFTRVCPMMSDVCPTDTMMMCPNGGMPPAAGRMMHGSSGSSGCQCVPDFLMALVHHAMPAATRMEATDRAKDVFKNEKVKLGKRTCTCTFTMETKGSKCAGQAKCDNKCTGNGAVEVGDYSFTLAVKKGKGKISKCTVAAMPTVGPVEPTGSGSGPAPTGSGTGPMPPTGSGSGMENPMSRCTCVGNGGSGPTPPTGSGSGPNPPTGTGSGSGTIGAVTRVRFELYPGSNENVESVGFDGQTLTLEDSTGFDPSKPIKVVIHGWHESELDNDGNVVDNNGYPSSFNELYSSNGFDFTVLGVHWVPIDGWNEELQTSSSSDAGNALGLLLKELSMKFNISSEQVHIIGFSMGTVVTSKAAKKIQDLGMPPLGRTTLLDPCPYHQASVISKTDAQFVEAIHTSSQGICQETPLAHVDFYPNGGDAQLCGTGSCACFDGSQVCDTCYHGSPRCLNFLGSPDWFANHFRAVHLYKESIGRPSAFLSWKCSETYSEFVENSRSCEASDTSEQVPMGEHSVENGRPEEGLYFLTTSGVSPYYNN